MLDVRIRRCSFLRDQSQEKNEGGRMKDEWGGVFDSSFILPPSSFATKLHASQSSSSGFVGRLPMRPKSLAVATRPSPKWCCQIRLTITRAVNGFCLSVIQRASQRRRPVVAGVGTGGADG